MPGVQQTLCGFMRYTGATAAILQQSGQCASIVRNGAGDWSVTLNDGGIDSTECAIDAYAEGADGQQRVWSFVHTSDTVKQLLARSDAGALSDATTVVVRFYRIGAGR